MAKDNLSPLKTVTAAQKIRENVRRTLEDSIIAINNLVGSNPHGLSAEEAKAAFGARLPQMAREKALAEQLVALLKT